MAESERLIDSGVVDLTDVALSELDRLDESLLASSSRRILHQVDHPSSSVGGHNPS